MASSAVVVCRIAGWAVANVMNALYINTYTIKHILIKYSCLKYTIIAICTYSDSVTIYSRAIYVYLQIICDIQQHGLHQGQLRAKLKR